MDCLKNISTTNVVQAIHGAYKRVVFLAPGIDEATAEALHTAWQRLGPEAVTVILDIDAEVVRLGYGTEKGLEDIQKAAAACNQAVAHQPGVRICVVVADDTTLIFTPTPLLIEGGSKEPDRPNGITLLATPKALGEELGIGEEGHAKREIGMEPVKAERIQAVKQDPVDFGPQKGVYLLHDGREVIYVGRASDQTLGKRLSDHTSDRLNTRWDRFSWFGLLRVTPEGKLEKQEYPDLNTDDLIKMMESILIEGLEPRQNRKRGDDLTDVEYLQVESPRLRTRRNAALLAEIQANMRAT